VLREVLDQIGGGAFSPDQPDRFRSIVDGLLGHDPYFLLADFAAYLEAQAEVERAYVDVDRWTRMSILNTARSAKFSSDRSIADYCRDIWDVRPQPIVLAAEEA
jgi:starch phosphorylase